MYKFGKKSLSRLEGVHPLLINLVHSAMDKQIMDFSVIEGVRTLEKQKDYVKRGVSKTLKSKHLIQPDGYGHAVDLYPYPIDMLKVNKGSAKEIARFGVLAGIMLTCSRANNIRIINGMDWDGDGETLDHSFFDAPHFQLLL